MTRLASFGPFFCLVVATCEVGGGRHVVVGRTRVRLLVHAFMEPRKEKKKKSVEHTYDYAYVCSVG